MLPTNESVEQVKFILPEGKYMGESLYKIFELDSDYVLFLSGRDLSFKQTLKYKSFFERIPEIVSEAKRLTENISRTNHQTQATVPGKNVAGCGRWRGW